jgi:hypothetical protein
LETLHGFFKCLQAFGIGNARRNGWVVACVDMSLMYVDEQDWQFECREEERQGRRVDSDEIQSGGFM